MKRVGTYSYRFFRGAVTHWRKPVYEECTLRVEVLGETQKKYRVKYLGFHANGSPVGYETHVDKGKVQIDGEVAAQTPATPQREDIRLPYKD